MHISKPEIRRVGDAVEISARVEVETVRQPVPQRLIYRFPAQYTDSISQRGDAFVAALLPLAMRLKEDIFFGGVISAQLLHGMQEWVRILSHWEPKQFSPIHIHVGGVLRAEPNPQAGIVLPFSGGVDSLYTLYTHLPPQETHPENQVHCALFVHGFDIPLNMPEEYQGWAQRFADELTPLGVPLIRCATNAQSFTEGILKWEYAHGAVLASLGLVLEPICSRLLISSTDSLTVLRPWGTSVVLDHWLSTESMTVCHMGISTERLEKIETVADWNLAAKLLRVCIDPARRAPGMNCSRCEKCLRTQTILKLIGRQDAIQTFSHPFSFRHILRWTSGHWLYIQDMARQIGKSRQYQHLLLLMVAAARFLANKLVRALMPQAVFRWLKKKVYPLEKNLFFTPNLPEEWRG